MPVEWLVPSLAINVVETLAQIRWRVCFPEFIVGRISTANLIGQPEFLSFDDFFVGILSIRKLFGWYRASILRLSFESVASGLTRNTCSYR